MQLRAGCSHPTSGLTQNPTATRFGRSLEFKPQAELTCAVSPVLRGLNFLNYAKG
jgi:hypothetical protein